MKILYGVAGEGMGHAVRAVPIIEHLQKKHEVTIIASSNAYEFLHSKFPHVHKVTGVHIRYKDNSVAEIMTVLSHLPKIPRFFKNLRYLFQFSPDIIITDFEFLTYSIGKLKRIPIISLDNIHVLTHANFKVPSIKRKNMGKAVVYARTPWCNEYIIPAFFKAVPKKHNVSLVAPLLRILLQNTKVTRKNVILVYQTSKSYQDTLVAVMKEFPDEQFKVYGLEGTNTKNVTFTCYGEKEFLKDLLSCKGIICNGGFSLIAEAIALGKPVLSIPVKKHYEQQVNALKLQEEGFGMMAERFTKNVLDEFLNAIPAIHKNQKRDHYPLLLPVLDSLLEKYSKHL